MSFSSPVQCPLPHMYFSDTFSVDSDQSHTFFFPDFITETHTYKTHTGVHVNYYSFSGKMSFST
jgi:hypothetical protein